jgi:hypothetical protein
LTNTRNLDGTQALDDNTLKNYSGKATMALSTDHRLMASYLWNDKIRGHRRDSNDLIPDIAAVLQTNPAQTTQLKYTGVFGPKFVFESAFSVMDGQTNYTYQPGTSADAIRFVDFTVGSQNFAAPRHEEQPNSRHQFDNTLSYHLNDWGGDHLLKLGVQWARLYFEQRYTVQGHHYVEYSGGNPNRIRLFNTPTVSKNLAKVFGIFFQDSWSLGPRVTLNIGARVDNYKGILPDQSNQNVGFDLFEASGVESDGTGPYIDVRSVANQEILDQTLAVWRTGLVWDVKGDGRTAAKANYSRYGLQVGIDRVTAVNPLTVGSRTCPWTDPNGDGRFQQSEITMSQCGAFSGGLSTTYAADGVHWPYSDEVTAGLERQLGASVRVGAMFYYRTNRDQLGIRNVAVPTETYTPFTVNVPNGPGGATTATVFNLAPSLVSASNQIRDNRPELDTDYKGVEFTASKRYSNRWQMVAGLTLGRNDGGRGGDDLNDPNLTFYPTGIIGNDSKVAFRLSGSYLMPYDIMLSGSMLSNTGYPYQSTYNVTRAIASAAGVSLTRSSQTVELSERGDERLPTVTMVDLRIARPIRIGTRRIVPQLDIFNLTNADTVVSLQNAVGSTYLNPREIVAPRIIRVGFSLDF